MDFALPHHIQPSVASQSNIRWIPHSSPGRRPPPERGTGSSSLAPGSETTARTPTTTTIEAAPSTHHHHHHSMGGGGGGGGGGGRHYTGEPAVQDPDELDDMVVVAANQATLDLLLMGSTLTATPYRRAGQALDDHLRRLLYHPHLSRNSSSDPQSLSSSSSAAAAAAEKEQQQEEEKEEITLARYNPPELFLDTKHYPEYSLPLHTTIATGDLVVIMESFDRLDFLYAQPGAIHNNRHGAFHHNDFIGEPWGGCIRSRDRGGLGFCHLLQPTPELWCRSLPHRTQVIHELDQSQIIFQLQIRPNQIVVESGTGSGALSHALLRTLAPAGHLHTYEFNQNRADTAREEFRQHGAGHLVTVHHRDVCREGFARPRQSVDAVVLDLPEPWRAVPPAAACLRPNGRLASYSPCMEQTQRTVLALRQAGFHSIQTFEYRLQEYFVDQVDYEGPPTEKRPKFEPHSSDYYDDDAKLAADSMNEPTKESGGTDLDPDVVVVDDDNDDENGDPEGNGSDQGLERGRGPETAQLKNAELSWSLPERAEATNSETPADPNNSGSLIPSDPKTGGVSSKKIKRRLVARPSVNMRGHTAFITLATAGLTPPANQTAVVAMEAAPTTTAAVPEPSPT